MKFVSKTEIQTMRRCQREHYFSYVLRRRPILKSKALRMGSAFDAGVQKWWTTVNVFFAIAAAQAVYDEYPGEDRQSYAYEMAIITAMLRGYDARWRHEPYDVLAVQQVIKAPITIPKIEYGEPTGDDNESYAFFGYADAIVRHQQTGVVSLIETKTSSEDIAPDAWFWRRTEMDIQVSHYLKHIRKMGFDVTDCIYDVAKKPDIRVLGITKTRLAPETPEEYGQRALLKIRETPDDYFVRATVVRLDHEELAAENDLRETVQLIDMGWSTRNPDACYRYGAPCSYTQVCSGVMSIDDDHVFKTAPRTKY